MDTCNIKRSDVLILSGKETINAGAYDFLKAQTPEEIGAFFAEVLVPEAFPDDGDIELVSILTKAIKEASKYDRLSRRREFLLNATSVGIDKMSEKLEIQTERISA